MLHSKRNPNQRAIDDAKDTASKVIDVKPHSIAIVNEIRKEYTLTEEIAILRKALVSMGCELPEFVQYNADIEAAKARVGENENN